MDVVLRRRALLCLLALLASLGGGSAVAASAPASATGTASLDLATMVLIPSDLHRPQATLFGGARFFADAFGSRQTIRLTAAGFRGGIEVWLGPPTRAGLPGRCVPR